MTGQVVSVWVVTASATYYPEGGTGDWQYVSADREAAARVYDAIMLGVDHGSGPVGHKALIEVRADSYGGTFEMVAECEA